MSSSEFESVIGLEIHAQLLTKSKLFCSCSTQFGLGDNENTCPVCMAMPGALPVLNAQAVEYSMKTGLALNCKIRETSVFTITTANIGMDRPGNRDFGIVPIGISLPRTHVN